MIQKALVPLALMLTPHQTERNVEGHVGRRDAEADDPPSDGGESRRSPGG